MRGRHASRFWRGFVAPFGALAALSRLPRAWPFALVPALTFVLLEAAFVVAGWRFLRPWVSSELAHGNALWHAGALLASWLSVLLTAALGWLLSAFLAPTLSASALE